jgi:hypothetical protein
LFNLFFVNKTAYHIHNNYALKDLFQLALQTIKQHTLSLYRVYMNYEINGWDETIEEFLSQNCQMSQYNNHENLQKPVYDNIHYVEKIVVNIDVNLLYWINLLQSQLSSSWIICRHVMQKKDVYEPLSQIQKFHDGPLNIISVSCCYQLLEIFIIWTQQLIILESNHNLIWNSFYTYSIIFIDISQKRAFIISISQLQFSHPLPNYQRYIDENRKSEYCQCYDWQTLILITIRYS